MAVSCLAFAPIGAAKAITAPRTTTPATVYAQTLGGYDPDTHEVVPLFLEPNRRFFIAYSVMNPNDFPVTFHSITFTVSTPEVPECAEVISVAREVDLTTLPRDLAPHETQAPLADNQEWHVSPFVGNVCQGVEVVFTPHPTATAELEPGEPEPTPPPAPAPEPSKPIVLETRTHHHHELARTGATSLLPLGVAGATFLVLGGAALTWSRRRDRRRP